MVFPLHDSSDRRRVILDRLLQLDRELDRLNARLDQPLAGSVEAERWEAVIDEAVVLLGELGDMEAG